MTELSGAMPGLASEGAPCRFREISSPGCPGRPRRKWSRRSSGRRRCGSSASIVSTGQASPPGFWYDQPLDEWIVVLAGSAGLLVEGEDGPRTLRAGDHVHLPAHCRHRVEWTDAARPTVWLAVHFAV